MFPCLKTSILLLQCLFCLTGNSAMKTESVWNWYQGLAKCYFSCILVSFTRDQQRKCRRNISDNLTERWVVVSYRNHLPPKKQLAVNRDAVRYPGPDLTQAPRGTKSVKKATDPDALKKITALENELLKLRAQIAMIVTAAPASGTFSLYLNSSQNREMFSLHKVIVNCFRPDRAPTCPRHACDIYPPTSTHLHATLSSSTSASTSTSSLP